MPSTEKEKAYSREYYWAHHEECKEKNRAYHKVNKEKLNTYNKEWRLTKIGVDPDYALTRDLKRFYDIDVEEYDAMVLASCGSCYICGRASPNPNRRLNVDHNHNTGKIRGLLCIKCNTSLRWYEDCSDKIVNYIDSEES